MFSLVRFLTTKKTDFSLNIWWFETNAIIYSHINKKYESIHDNIVGHANTINCKIEVTNYKKQEEHDRKDSQVNGYASGFMAYAQYWNQRANKTQSTTYATYYIILFVFSNIECQVA